MNERLNMQDLIDMLAEKHGMSKKHADGFVKEFFQLIEEALETDKYVKIKGLGTFKLIEVGSRESVNVNTGERFEIQGHTKVSFTPDAALKDTVNKPFSHFESVALNDDITFEDTPLEDENEEEADETTRTLEDISSMEKPTLVEEADIPQTDVATDEKDAADASTIKYFIGIVVLVVVLCGAAVAFMYYPDLLDKPLSKPLVEKKEEPRTDASAGKSNTALTDSAALRDSTEETDRTDTIETVVAASTVNPVAKEDGISESVPMKEKPKAAVPFEPDSVGYQIVGTETVYTVKEGETLTKIALRFYGTKALWPYIAKHNPDVIKNPDNVPYGTIIKIPKLAKKQ
ncbi:nucleoid DNA-binding protein [Bacteroides zoogleoformans]|uniref:Peptidoglycan-binding protein LysM n=1 Tax=Bacteroides zoogleoformans TaxID=28119 RepID=A0ABM6T580_9BACE|nr:HU family DNA-binding protein [Bacteroides zoogleoformans]AVM51886.1 peptidoglycan-binding protein LysM [Bacteroides zoogleoformans]TWJ16985.1 nucleoid DNA-binding protein [Bacteroides zoogleoformans]